jgi:hypothetical protein
VRLGQERIGKFELFYGYDLYVYSEIYKRYDINIFYNQIYNGVDYVYYNFNVECKYKDTSTSFGVSPIFGFKYFLIPRLCFSAEAKADIGYSIQTKSQENNRYYTLTKEKESKILTSSKKGLDVRISPWYLINMGYYL